MQRFSLTSAERETYRRYARLALPRHTSYPIVPVWTTEYGPVQLRQDLQEAAAQKRPLSLYVHVPFCQSLCYYCACTKEIIPVQQRQQHDPAEELLEGLRQEMERLAPLLATCSVHQLHLGGGSPTFLTVPQLQRLWSLLAEHFSLAPAAEIAIEIDPRITSREQLTLLRQLGFNRVSLGIQDFDPRVQQAVHRQQPFDMVAQTVAWCRELGFASINFDLIYGLPFQTVQSMAATLDQVLTLGPDRIAFYRLAVIPEIFRWQKVFHSSDLPDGDLSLDLNLLAIQRFLQAGYQFLGLDHFAKPTELLAQACQQQTLQRNFQGMTTGKELEIVGLGPSGISQFQQAFAQNIKSSKDWFKALAQDLATERGLRLTADDRLRREVLQQLYGHGVIPFTLLEARFGIVFEDYFASELQRLEELIEQGLVQRGPDQLGLTEPLGRLLARVVAAVFDRYLPPSAFREGLSEQHSSRVG